MWALKEEAWSPKLGNLYKAAQKAWQEANPDGNVKNQELALLVQVRVREFRKLPLRAQAQWREKAKKAKPSDMSP